MAQQIVRISSIDPDKVMKDNKIRGSVCRKPMVFDRCRKWLDLIPEEFSDAAKNKRSVVLVKPHMARMSGWIVMFRIDLVKPHMARTSGWHCYV